MVAELALKIKTTSDLTPSPSELIRAMLSGEIIFGVVGPVGAGTSEVANALEAFLSEKGYDAKVLKARDVIASWAQKTGKAITSEKSLNQAVQLQDLGDELRRTTDSAAVALRLINEIRTHRAERLGLPAAAGEVIEPTATPRAYILDALRNPAEIDLLRRLYQQSFCLIGVVCEEDVRKRRLQMKFPDAGLTLNTEFMLRDERAAENTVSR